MGRKGIEYEKLIGQRYSHLVVLGVGFIEYKFQRAMGFDCICDCGISKRINALLVIKGKTISCGCKQKKSNGLSRSRVYKSYIAMKTRCFDVKCHSYVRYGGAGITVCERWVNSFNAFLEDMGHPPSDKHTIDRIDNLKSYNKENCRWATPKEQARNRKNSVTVIFENKEWNAFELCEKIGVVSAPCFLSRVKRGWDVKQALITTKLQH